MNEEQLAEWESGEIKEAKARSSDVVARGHVATPADLYPEIRLRGSVGYARSLVPLSLLVLLYDNVAVFVPPRPQEELQRRWGMSVDTVAELARAGVVRPLVGHHPEYVDDHFSALLETEPPSVWARGVALLEALGLEDALKPSECPLPIKDMAHLPQLRRRFSGYIRGGEDRALTERITLELLTNYADLWIFGEGEFADALALDDDPNDIAARLFAANELRTYPTLFGFGGTANYDLGELARRPSLVSEVDLAAKTKSVRTITPNLAAVLQGVGITLRSMTVDDILAFRASGDGRRLRNAIAYFEEEATRPTVDDPAPPNFIEAAQRLEEVLSETSETLMSETFAREVAATTARVDLVFRAGGVAAAESLGWLLGVTSLGYFGLLAGVGGAVGGWKIVDVLIPPRWRDRAVELRVRDRFNPGVANLWKIKSRREA